MRETKLVEIDEDEIVISRNWLAQLAAYAKRAEEEVTPGNLNLLLGFASSAENILKYK